MCAHQSLASPRPGLLLTDLNSNERGDTHEGSEQMLGASSQRIGVVRSYPRKNQIIHEDDPAAHVYEVVSGTICACKMLRDGRRQISGFYFSGDVFGLENAKKQNVERIICFLIDMVERASPREDHFIALPMSRQDIADYLGLTIETVSRTLWDLERRGAIEISGYHSIAVNG